MREPGESSGLPRPIFRGLARPGSSFCYRTSGLVFPEVSASRASRRFVNSDAAQSQKCFDLQHLVHRTGHSHFASRDNVAEKHNARTRICTLATESAYSR